MHQRFEAQAHRTPDHIALSCGESRLTYGELNQRANRLAHHLVRLGVGPNVFVGLCLDRTPELVVGLLAILKAGGTYVPIDPQYPPDRVAFMLRDSRAPVMVTQRALAADLHLESAKTVVIDADWPEISKEPGGNLGSVVRAEHLAYVIYTSGSTGQPKGTQISHRNVVRLFDSTEAWFHFNERDVWTLFHSCAFDFSVWELWGALFYGGRLVVVPFGVSRTPDAFHQLLREERVTVLNQTPSAFGQLVRADEAAPDRSGLALRLVIFGGEALDFASLDPWFRRHGDQLPRLVNMYGITETTVHVTYRPICAGDVDSASVIGIPIPDLQVHVLDERREPVAPGEPGEIYVGGAGVCHGYLNRPELTAEKFVPDPFSPVPGARLYRSGDSARYLPNGELEYLGRIDSQVKIRGFRIELGEIRSAINAHPAVADSVVIVGEPTKGEKSLLAYVVRRPQLEVAPADLRQRLRKGLPEYMIPSHIMFLHELPLTVNGKLDVKALPPPPAPVTSTDASLTGSALERGIAKIWRAVLKVPTAGLDQNFFDLGGNSLNLAAVHEQMQQLLGVDFSITELFAHSTIKALAAHFDGASTTRTGAAANAASARAQRQRDALLAQRNMRRERK